MEALAYSEIRTQAEDFTGTSLREWLDKMKFEELFLEREGLAAGVTYPISVVAHLLPAILHAVKSLPLISARRLVTDSDPLRRGASEA
jgi:hypothetical protein